MLKLLKYLKNHKLVTIAGPLLKLAEALMETFVPFIMSLIINYGIKTGDTAYILKKGLLLVVIAVLGWIFAISAQYFCAKASMIFGREIRNDLYKKILGMDMTTVDRFTISGLITRTTNDVNRLQTGLNLMLRLLLRIPFIVLGAIIMSGVINIKVMFLYIAAVPLLAVVTTAAIRLSMPYYDKIQKITDRIGTFCRENILGVKSVRAFRMQKKESADFAKKTDELYDNQVKAEYFNASVTPLNTIIINIGIILILVLGAKMVNKEQLLNGDIIALVNYLMQILISVERTCSLIISFNKAEISGKRIMTVLDFKPTESTVNASDEKEEALEEAVVRFENVSFAYSGSEKDAVTGLDFTVYRNESLGIIGGTGSGKSTVTDLLRGIYPVTRGSVKLFGLDVKAYSEDELKAIFSVVPQKASLFKGSVRENMLFANKDATDEMITEALSNACALDFVSEKGGLDFEIEYGGVNLSGGQKQRLTIARAFLKSARVIVMDDSTSALDYVTESKIRKFVNTGLNRFDAKIIVSQRISAVSGCDKILVLDEGRPVGFGTHEQLSEECEVYKEIMLSQTGGLLSTGGAK